MNEAKRWRWCNPLEGVGTEGGDYDSRYYNFWREGGGVGGREARAGGRGPPSI